MGSMYKCGYVTYNHVHIVLLGAERSASLSLVAILENLVSMGHGHLV